MSLCTIMKNPKNKLFIGLSCLVAGMAIISSCGSSKKEKEEQAQTVQAKKCLIHQL